jgi:CDGSH-type Zn-finger protein/uncharacterized Fe-S cluster protein YjdI
MSAPVKEYAGDGFTVSYDASRCIHAAECVHGLPIVFDPDARPWIQPRNGSAAEVAAVVARCPTGALSARDARGVPLAAPDARNSLTIRPDGPLYLRGRFVIDGGAHASTVEHTRVALCRCGQSRNKPFCDNSHTKAGFADSGVCPPRPHDARDGEPVGPLRLTPIPNGPLKVQGWIEFNAADGTRYAAGDKVWLCRCGQSQNKPFCDGTHKKVGFTG